MNELKQDRHLSDDVRKKYISELHVHKDSWFPVIIFPVWIIATFIAVDMSGSNIKGAEWLGVIGVPLVVISVLQGILEKITDTKRKLQNHSDEMLELLYNKMEKKEQFKKFTSQIITAIAVVGIGILLFLAFSSVEDNIVKRLWSNLITDAKCSVVSKNASSDSFLVSGQPNYGITVSTKLKNSGEDGNVSVVINLSSSEGGLKREQTIFMNAGEVQNLKFQFAELTVNATNIKYSVLCSP